MSTGNSEKNRLPQAQSIHIKEEKSTDFEVLINFANTIPGFVHLNCLDTFELIYANKICEE